MAADMHLSDSGKCRTTGRKKSLAPTRFSAKAKVHNIYDPVWDDQQLPVQDAASLARKGTHILLHLWHASSGVWSPG